MAGGQSRKELPIMLLTVEWTQLEDRSDSTRTFATDKQTFFSPIVSSVLLSFSSPGPDFFLGP
jgi:hypothetical protein